jgi:hypothetical protein
LHGGTCLFRPQRWRGRGVCGLSLVLQTPLPPGSHRCPVNWPVARKAEGAHLRQCSGMSPELGENLDVPVRAVQADPLPVLDQPGCMLDPDDGR